MKKKNNTFSLNSLCVTLVNLGCDKNRVDAEKMLYKFKEMGFKIATNIEKSDIIVVNTCAFIKSAITESENSIEMALAKKKGAKIIITGCYAQRFYDIAKQKYQDCDLVLKLDESQHIEDFVYSLYGNVARKTIDDTKLTRFVSTPKHYAYLKISDGCNNFCTYCTIPYIRGRYKSEPIEKLVKESQLLAQNGVKEIILIAQDVTRYGQDLYGKTRLVDLIKEISKIPQIECIRLHYCYPEMVDDSLIEEIVTNNKVAKYMDIPLQHISDNILKAMNRRGDSKTIKDLLVKLYEKKITIRTTFIVGFPNETKQDFKELVKFLKSQKMKYVGFFAYSQEENTKAGEMSNQIDEKTKIKRLNKIQKIQTKILLNIQKQQNGVVCKAICDGFDGVNGYVFRPFDSSPDVDTFIRVFSDERLKVGDYYTIKIVKNFGIDLVGVLVD